jgi:hypothetical protein
MPRPPGELTARLTAGEPAHAFVGSCEGEFIRLRVSFSKPNAMHQFEDRDVQRAIKAARTAGLDPVAVTINPRSGAITVHGARAADVRPTQGQESVAVRAADEALVP